MVILGVVEDLPGILRVPGELSNSPPGSWGIRRGETKKKKVEGEKSRSVLGVAEDLLGDLSIFVVA